MKNIQEQLEQASDAYEKNRWSHGVIDPVVLDEIGDAFFQGAEYGYQLAVDKACEWLKKNTYSVFTKSCSLFDAVEEFVENFKQEMEGGGNEN